jgi:hypothetical protein
MHSERFSAAHLGGRGCGGRPTGLGWACGPNSSAPWRSHARSADGAAVWWPALAGLENVMDTVTAMAVSDAIREARRALGSQAASGPDHAA